MAELPNVRLNLSNRAENVLLVREMLSGVAETVGVAASDLDHIRTAVTEACNNVVLHAYRGGNGSLEVEVHLGAPGAIEVVVRDHGAGIRPRIRAAEETPLGVGLPVIQALVRRVEFRDPPGGGTEARMEFATPGTRALEPARGDRLGSDTPAQAQPAATTGLAIGPPELARRVLPRVLTVLAAHAHFCTDRISDVQVLADTLAAHAHTRARDSRGASHLTAAVTVAPRELELRIGPRTLRLVDPRGSDAHDLPGARAEQ